MVTKGRKSIYDKKYLNIIPIEGDCKPYKKYKKIKQDPDVLELVKRK